MHCSYSLTSMLISLLGTHNKVLSPNEVILPHWKETEYKHRERWKSIKRPRFKESQEPVLSNVRSRCPKAGGRIEKTQQAGMGTLLRLGSLANKILKSLKMEWEIGRVPSSHYASFAIHFNNLSMWFKSRGWKSSVVKADYIRLSETCVLALI